MKLFPALSFAYIIALCPPVLAQEAGAIIEEAILWEAEMNPDMSPAALSRIVQDTALFEESGNFFRAVSPITAFGGNLSYVGLLGVEMLPGPNAVIESAPEEIASYLENKYELSFESEAGVSAFQAELDEDIMLVIFEHPSLAGSSVIIGAYLGP